MSQPALRESQRIGSALLRIGAECDAELGEGFQRWCEELAVASLALPGFVSVRHFARSSRHAGIGESPRQLILYDLEDASVPASAAAAGALGAPEAPSSRVRLRRSVLRELGAASGRRVQPTGSAILVAAVEVERAWVDAFLEWYAGQHVPAVLEAPGMIGARRFEELTSDAGADLRPAPRRYWTVYEMEDAEVIARPELAQAASRGACPAHLEPHRVARHQVYEEIFRAPRS